MADIVRQLIVLALATGQIASAIMLFGSGFETAPTPAASAEAQRAAIVPASYAFAIWGPIFLSSVLLGLFQAWPPFGADPTLRRVGWLCVVGFGACIAWNTAARLGPVWLTVPLIAVMLASLGSALVVAARATPTLPGLRLCVVAPLALYAGWLTVAIAANTTEISASYGFGRFGLSAEAFSLLLIGVAAVVALILMAGARYPLVYAAAVVWGLLAVIVENLSRGGPKVLLLVTAIVAGIVVVATLYRRFLAPIPGA